MSFFLVSFIVRPFTHLAIAIAPPNTMISDGFGPFGSLYFVHCPMFQFSIAAINDTDLKSQWEPLAPTKEARASFSPCVFIYSYICAHIVELLEYASICSVVILDLT